MLKVRKTAEIEYPESDGKPMAETDDHRDWMVTNIQRLQRRYAGQHVYVSGNLLIYFVKGDPRKCVAPDAFVVKDCAPGRRRIFKIWEERRKPNFALETTSRKTRREDAGPKKELYALLRVKDYFLFDPFGEWLKPPLQGFRLIKGEYKRIRPDAEGGITSRELGVRFLLENGDLAMFDAITGERLLSQEEWRQQETQRADAAEQNVQAEKRRAEAEKQRANAEKQRADAEAAARKVLEERLASLQYPHKKTNGQKRRNGK